MDGLVVKMSRSRVLLAEILVFNVNESSCIDLSGCSVGKIECQVGKKRSQVGKFVGQVGIEIFRTKGSLIEKAFGDGQKQ